MSLSLRSNLFSSSSPLNFPRSKPTIIATTATTTKFITTIRCGSKDPRAPLSKGRILNIESIQAIQALKRAKSNEEKLNNLLSKTLTRLVKKDLIATLTELLRQDQCELALKVFSAVRSEFWYRTDCSLYADLVAALARNGMVEEMDELIVEFENEGLGEGGGGKISRLIKALVAAERKEAVVRVFGVMKKGGWRSREAEVDEYVVKVLSRGLRRLGEGDVADEVEREFGDLLEGSSDKVMGSIY